MINNTQVVRTALQSDHSSIANLMYFEPHVHRHLDWRGPLEWLGVPEYWVLEKNESIVAALACPPDPEGVAWLRLFTHSEDVSPEYAWREIWQRAKTNLEERNLIAAAITVSDWFGNLLSESGFSVKQKIVVLEQYLSSTHKPVLLPGVVLRPMNEADLTSVIEVDWAGFAPLWRNSQQALRVGFLQGGISMVALVDEEIVGYQISTTNALGAHLARLAVLPRMQGRGIGNLLVQDLINRCIHAGLYRLTVNTQDDNKVSLSLYRKTGFQLSGEYYSVFSLQL